MNNNNECIVLIDMDDTIVDLLSKWVGCLNKTHNLSIAPEQITDWDIHQFFPMLTKEQVFAPLFTDGFWSTVEPKDGAVEYVKKLKDDGYRVMICTNTNYTTLKEKMEKVLFRHFNFLSWDDVIIVRNKQLINADFLVDDGIHNLIDGRYRGILMDAPHNRNFNEHEHGIIRASTWKEVYEFIRDMTK